MKHLPFFKLSKTKIIAACGLFQLIITVSASAQSPTPKIKKDAKWTHRAVLLQTLKSADNYNMLKLDEMVLPPGSTDTIKHQHMAHLAGFIIEGEVTSKMKDKPAQTFTKGQAFYEYPGEVHEYLKNNNPDKPAKILLYYLYRNEADLYRKVDEN